MIPGPMPRETIAYLRNLDIPVQFIQGNGERDVLEHMRGIDTDTVPEQFRQIVSWTAQQLDPDQEQWLVGWPATLRVRIRGLGEVLFCHATPRSDTEMLHPSNTGRASPVGLCGSRRFGGRLRSHAHAI